MYNTAGVGLGVGVTDKLVSSMGGAWVFHMVNSVTCMNVGTSLEKAIKRVLNKL